MKVSTEFDAARRKSIKALVATLSPVQHELSLSQILALFWIAQEPGLSVNDLSERLDCPQQTASRYVAALLGRYQDPNMDIGRKRLDPLIEQRVSEQDSRSRALFLSKQGRDFIERIISSTLAGAVK